MDFIEVLNQLFSDLENLFGKVVGFAVAVVIFILICKGGFSLAKVISGMLVGGLVIWLVGFGGIETVGQWFDSTADGYGNG